ncbi:cation:proton antiporter [Diplocloster modestus]|uniref:Cation:proton antiporter n=1 Tax=Diplocloster modestus TaxID=2850322 RepID=A0ABS6K467_9FIRM|nr:cation:proton antiporter [Diplocloster modestus]MBU9725324.1 cation:proton antiporter [Diplocloster modestus]
MLLSLALIFLCGLLLGSVFEKLKLPRLLGMLLVGILLGPHVLDLLDGSILSISSEVREIALIIILVKAGLSLDINDLKKVGRPAVMMCFVPATLEIIAFLIFGPALLHVSLLEAGIIGAVMGAVSPAVIVPKMSKMIDEGWGTDKGIPQMIIAGSSADDVYVIVIFTALVSLAGGGSASVMDFVQIPISIILGIVLGVITGLGMVKLFQSFHMRDSVKVLIILSVSFLFVTLENMLENIVSVSGLLAVMSMGMMIYNRYDQLAKRISGKFSKLWVAAEIILFVLVGATVDIQYAAKAGVMVVVMLLIGLAFRLFGTWLCVIKTALNRKERLFCLLAQLPKATVQAAIGGVPLAKGLACGNIVLTVAVVSILISAPIGAFMIDKTYKKFLNGPSAS